MKAKLLFAALFCIMLIGTLVSCNEQYGPTVHVHEYLTMPAVEPTCTQPGYTDGLKCLTCGFIFEKPTVAPATGHTPSSEWTIDREPTEYRDGEKSLHCTKCGKRSSISPIPRLAPTTQGLAYELNETGDAYICVGIGTATMEKELRIPARHNGLPVIAIGENAFENNRRIVALSLPDSVKTIGRSAFLGCWSLSSIALPDTVEYIGSYAFFDTDYYLDGTVWEEGMLYIGKHLISVDPSAADGVFSVRSNTATIAGSAFISCSTMTAVIVPEGVVSIGNSCFYNCFSLKELILPDSLRIIGDGALAYCTSLTDFVLPGNVESIARGLFPGCISLTRLEVDESNPFYYSVGNCLIEHNTGRLISGCANAVIPNDGSIKYIDSLAFYELPGLTDLTLPDGIITIGEKAFANCSELRHLSLPASITTISTNALLDCTSLTSLHYEGTEQMWNQIVKESDWDLGTPYMVLTFGQ